MKSDLKKNLNLLLVVMGLALAIGIYVANISANEPQVLGPNQWPTNTITMKCAETGAVALGTPVCYDIGQTTTANSGGNWKKAVAANVRYFLGVTQETVAAGSSSRMIAIAKDGPCSALLLNNVPSGAGLTIEAGATAFSTTADPTKIVAVSMEGNYSGAAALKQVLLKPQILPTIDVRVIDIAKKYPLGERYAKPDGRTFRYTYVGTGGLQAEFGSCFGYKTVAVAAAPAQATGAGVVGSYTVSATIEANEEPASGAFSTNDPFMVGGSIVIGNGRDQHPQNRRIVGCTSLTNAGGIITLTLDEPLDTVVTVGTTTIEIAFNPYAYSTSGNVTNSEYVWFNGVPAITCAAGSYTWVQTAGPAWITSNFVTGKSLGARSIYFVANGSVVSGNDEDTTDNTRQLAGYPIDMSGSSSSNAPFVMLQIAP